MFAPLKEIYTLGIKSPTTQYAEIYLIKLLPIKYCEMVGNLAYYNPPEYI